MNEGFESMRLGLRGMPAAAEEVMVYRDIALAELTGGRLHILHVSTAGSVELIRRGKATRRPRHRRGVPAPLHADRRVPAHLRQQLQDDPAAADAGATSRPSSTGCKDGTLDVLATDHAPHAPEKKMRELDQAPNGIIGLETLLPICVNGLIEPGHLTWPQLIEKLTVNPARVLGIDRGTLQARGRSPT